MDRRGTFCAGQDAPDSRPWLLWIVQSAKVAARLLLATLFTLSTPASSLIAGDANAVRSTFNLAIATDKADHSYALREPVTWLLTLTGGQAGDMTPTPAYSISSGHASISTGILRFVDGKASVTCSIDHPGVVQLKVDLATAQRADARCAAVVALSAIISDVPEAPDFDAFWQKKLGEVAAVPLNPVLVEVPSGSPTVQLWVITMDGFRGSRIQGYLARPRGFDALPAQLQLQYWGVYPLLKKDAVGIAAKGWVAMDIMAHDLPDDRDEAFYREADRSGRYNVSIGVEDPETCYFLRMFLSCSRAIDYLAGRSDWNRRTLLVQGGSQGGFQALAAAGLNPKVTAVTVSVPGGCDLAGMLEGRQDGWPEWLATAQGAVRDARIRTISYYDAKNFAKRIRCPTLVGIGLLDQIASPVGQCAMFNNLNGPRQLVIEPTDGHVDEHAAFKAAQLSWWKTAAAGGKLP